MSCNDGEYDCDTFPTWAIVVIVIAVIAKILFWTCVCYFCCARRRRYYMASGGTMHVAVVQPATRNTNIHVAQPVGHVGGTYYQPQAGPPPYTAESTEKSKLLM